MNNRKGFGFSYRVSAVAFLFSLASAAVTADEVYTFTDAGTGLMLDLPSSWERRDPDNPKQILDSRASNYLSQPQGQIQDRKRYEQIIVIALAKHLTETSGFVPGIKCQHTPSEKKKGEKETVEERAADIKRIVDFIDKGYGRPMNSVVEHRLVSGHDTYWVRKQPSAEKKIAGTTTLSLSIDKYFIQCIGMYTKDSQVEINRVLDSLRLQQ